MSTLAFRLGPDDPRPEGAAPAPDPIARDLARLSASLASSGELAAAALRRRRATRTLGTPWRVAVAAAASLLLMVVVIGAIIPSLGRARMSSVTSSAMYGAPPESAPESLGVPIVGSVSMHQDAAGAPQPPAEPQPAAMPRAVIRRATVDLIVESVPAAQASITALVSEARGEFIENVSVTGERQFLTATLTLRVDATRLDAVLAQLRALGQVRTEQVGGEDVSDQLIDLDARLRNERRIEQELLTLLDTRKDAPLEDVLKVRESLASVRGTIERLAAQQQRLSRLVALSTVTVTLRTLDVRPPDDDGLGSFFAERMSDAWSGGLRGLVRSVAWFVEVVLGGLVLWLVLGALALVITVWRKRRRRRLAEEPAPLA